MALQVAVDITHHQLLAGLQSKVNPKEVVVGWYALFTSLIRWLMHERW